MTVEFRNALPQILATTVKNMLLMNIGLTVGFLQLCIHELTQNQDSGLKFSEEQVSWFSSLIYLFQPLSALVSGLLVSRLGRKRCLLLVNVPYLTAWLLFGWASHPAMLFAGAALFGTSIGLLEAPVKTYAGEVCQPELRGILSAYSGLFFPMGFAIPFSIGVSLPWQTVALYSAACPVLCFLCILLIPDSPQWLISRNRRESAAAALCWLRGWVNKSVVEKEFTELEEYLQNANPRKQRCEELLLPKDEQESSTKKADALAAFLQPETRRPLALVALYFAFTAFSCVGAFQMYFQHIAHSLGAPLSPHWIMIINSGASIVTCVLGIATVSVVGKRGLTLASFAGMTASCVVIAASKFFSSTWVPITALAAATFFGNLGAFPLPWILISEIFPFRTRGLASGVAASICHVLFFCVSKTFLSLEAALTIHGLFWWYAIVAAVGGLYLYFYLPETERRSLTELENFFKKNSRPNPQYRKIPK